MLHQNNENNKYENNEYNADNNYDDMKYKMNHMKYNIEKRKIEIEKIKQQKKFECEEKKKAKKILQLKKEEDRNNIKKMKIIKLKKEKIKKNNDKIQFKQNNYKKQIDDMYFNYFIKLNGIDFDAINRNINDNLTLNVPLVHLHKIHYNFDGPRMTLQLTNTIDCKAYNIIYEHFKTINNYKIDKYLDNLRWPKFRCLIIINNLNKINNKINNEINFFGRFGSGRRIYWFNYGQDDYQANINNNMYEHVYIVSELKNKPSFTIHNK
jgi:hypothetical protein